MSQSQFFASKYFVNFKPLEYGCNVYEFVNVYVNPVTVHVKIFNSFFSLFVVSTFRHNVEIVKPAILNTFHSRNIRKVLQNAKSIN